jgi:hypothetical protein
LAGRPVRHLALTPLPYPTPSFIFC